MGRLLIAENPIQAVTLAFQLGFDGKIGGGGTLNPSAENAPHRLLDVLTRDPWTRRKGLD